MLISVHKPTRVRFYIRLVRLNQNNIILQSVSYLLEFLKEFERMQYSRNNYKFQGHLHGSSGQFDKCLYTKTDDLSDG